MAITTELGTMLMTGDYKFDQTPVDGVPADVSRLAELGREGLLLLCGDSTNADRPDVAVRVERRAAAGRCSPLPGGRIVVTCFASNIHRVQQVVDAAAALDRRVSLVGRSMRKNTNIGRMLGHIDIPEGMLVGPKEIEDFPDQARDHLDRVAGRAAVGAAPDGARRPPERRARRRHGDLLGHADPGNERAVNETIDRIYRSART